MTRLKHSLVLRYSRTVIQLRNSIKRNIFGFYGKFIPISQTMFYSEDCDEVADVTTVLGRV